MPSARSGKGNVGIAFRAPINIGRPKKAEPREPRTSWWTEHKTQAGDLVPGPGPEGFTDLAKKQKFNSTPESLGSFLGDAGWTQKRD